MGDTVTAGMVLAQLDTSDVQLSIEERNAANEYNQLINDRKIEMTEKERDQEKDNIDKGLQSELVAQKNRVKTAQRAMDEARKIYNDSDDIHTDADGELTKAEKEFYKRRDTMEAAKLAFENDPTNITKKQAYDDAELEFQKANTALLNAQGNVLELSRERLDYRKARIEYENEVATLAALENKIQQNLDKYEDTIVTTEMEIDEKSNQIMLEKLQKQLSDAVVYAPISGTVTEVYLKEGEPASSAQAMFIIENTENLVIKTKIKEYDVTSITPGMKAIIKSDATGDAEYEGEVSWIDPVAIKNADGSVKKDGSIEFNTDVDLLSLDTELRVGMNVRLNVIVDEIQDVYAVPFDSVLEDPVTMEEYILVAKEEYDEKRKANQYVAKRVVVDTGLETDFYVQISSPELAAGDIIISKPAIEKNEGNMDAVLEGDVIALTPQALAGYTPSAPIELKDKEKVNPDEALGELLGEEGDDASQDTSSAAAPQPEPVVMQVAPDPAPAPAAPAVQEETPQEGAASAVETEQPEAEASNPEENPQVGENQPQDTQNTASAE